MSALRWVWKGPGWLLSAALIVAVRGYQRLLRPLLPPMCRFQPGCSEYFIGAVRKYGPVCRAAKGAGRVMWIGGVVLAVPPMTRTPATAWLFALDGRRLACAPGHPSPPQLRRALGVRIAPEPDTAIRAGPPQANRGTPRSALLVVE